MAIVYSRPILSDTQPNRGRAPPLHIPSTMSATVNVDAVPNRITLPTLKSLAIGAICAVAIKPLAETITNMM